MDYPMENKQRKATTIGFSSQSYDSFRENKPLQIRRRNKFSSEYLDSPRKTQLIREWISVWDLLFTGKKDVATHHLHRAPRDETEMFVIVRGEAIQG